MYDSNKKAVSFQDIYCKSIKLQEGQYTLKAQVTSSSVYTLNQLKSTSLLLEYAISKPLYAPLFNTFADTFILSGAPFKTATLRKGGRTCFYVGDFPEKSMPKDSSPGDILLGSLELLSDGSKTDVPLYTVAYLIPPEYKDKDAEIVTDKEPEKEKSIELAESVRDLEISYLKKMEGEARMALFVKLETQYPNFLPLFKTQLDALFEDFEKALLDKKVTPDQCQSLLKASNKVIGMIKEPEVAMFFGVQQQENDTSQRRKNVKQSFEEQRQALSVAYRCVSLCHRESLFSMSVEGLKPVESKSTKSAKPKSISGKSVGSSEENSKPAKPVESIASKKAFESFELSLLKYGQWTPDAASVDGYYVLLWSFSKSRGGYDGAALNALMKYTDNGKNKSKGAVYRQAVLAKEEALKKLGWALWVEYECKWNMLRFPAAHATF